MEHWGTNEIQSLGHELSDSWPSGLASDLPPRSILLPSPLSPEGLMPMILKILRYLYSPRAKQERYIRQAEWQQARGLATKRQRDQLQTEYMRRMADHDRETR